MGSVFGVDFSGEVAAVVAGEVLGRARGSSRGVWVAAGGQRRVEAMATVLLGIERMCTEVLPVPVVTRVRLVVPDSSRLVGLDRIMGDDLPAVVWLHAEPGVFEPARSIELRALCEQRGVPLVMTGHWQAVDPGLVADGLGTDLQAEPVVFPHLDYAAPPAEPIMHTGLDAEPTWGQRWPEHPDDDVTGHVQAAADAGFPTGEHDRTPLAEAHPPATLVTLVRELVKVWNDTARVVATGGNERAIGNLVAHLENWVANEPLSAPLIVLSERELATMRTTLDYGSCDRSWREARAALTYVLAHASTGVEQAPADRGCLVPLRTEMLAAEWRDIAEMLPDRERPRKRDRWRAKALRWCADELQRALAADRTDPESAPGIAPGGDQ